jgi:hypothetical protein
MHPASRIVAVAAVAAAASLAVAARAAPKGPFEVKSGVLESTTTGLGQQATETLYFDDFGRKQATFTTTKIDLGGVKSTSHTVRIQLPDGTSYDIDLDQKTGRKMKIPPEAAAAMAAAMTAEVSKDVKVERLPDKQLLGRTCKGVKAEGMGIPAKTWTWKGLPLLTEAALGGGSSLVTTATRLETDVAVPAEKFAVPAGVRIEDMQP